MWTTLEECRQRNFRERLARYTAKALADAHRQPFNPRAYYALVALPRRAVIIDHAQRISRERQVAAIRALDLDHSDLLAFLDTARNASPVTQRRIAEAFGFAPELVLWPAADMPLDDETGGAA